MIIEGDTLGEDLRAWLKSPAIGIPEYSTDLIVQRRVGRMLTKSEVLPRAKKKLPVVVPTA